MTHISDEILNKYIDNELEGIGLSELNEHLKCCSSCLAKLKSLRLVDQQLRRLETFQVKADFTQNLMKRIERMSFQYKPKKSYFFRFIIAAFLVLTAAIIFVAALTIHPSAPQAISAKPDWYKTTTDIVSGKISNILSVYRSLFASKGFPVVGSGMAFIILISIYVLYESFKGAKGRLH